MLNFSFALTTTSMLMCPKLHQLIQQPLLLFCQLTLLPFLLLILPPVVELSMAIRQMPMSLYMLTESGIFGKPVILILHIIECSL